MIERRSDVTGNMHDAKRRLLKRTQTMRDFAIYQRTDGPIQGRRPSPNGHGHLPIGILRRFAGAPQFRS
jgi:hypothetical protein